MAGRTGSKRIGIRDRLGRLTYRGACRMMATDSEDGPTRLRGGSRFDINIARDVHLGGDILRVNVSDPNLDRGYAIVTIVEQTRQPSGLLTNCDQCQSRCEHTAAVLSMVLDDRMTLGLSAAPTNASRSRTLRRRNFFVALGRSRAACGNRKDDPSVARSQDTVERLHDHQQAFG
ncbi:MAG: hypothetical protein R3C05_19270 [Pirellulaceae bacterium]